MGIDFDYCGNRYIVWIERDRKIMNNKKEGKINYQ
jgi:hypothetical protein